MICGLLRSAEIVCDHRATQSGVKFGGPQEVLCVGQERVRVGRLASPSYAARAPRTLGDALATGVKGFSAGASRDSPIA